MRRILLSVPVAALLLTGSVHSAAASGIPPSMAAHGTFTIDTDNFTYLGSSGTTTYFAEVATGVYSGGLSGPWVDTDTFVLFGNGSFYSYGTETCSPCTLGRRTGSFTSQFFLQGAGLNYAGTLRFTGGTGGLAGLQGGGPFAGDGTTNTYTYYYGFGS